MKYSAPIIALFGLLGGVSATMSPANMQDTGNSLARQAFDIKDLVVQINSTMNTGPMQVSALRPLSRQRPSEAEGACLPDVPTYHWSNPC